MGHRGRPEVASSLTSPPPQLLQLLLFLLLLLLPLLAAGIGPDDDVETLPGFNLTASDSDGEVVVDATASTARKCCPPGLSMYRVMAPGCDNQVTCKIPDNPAGLSSIMWSLQPGGPQYGFPTACPREQCHLVLLENATSEPYCVDKLVETDDSGQAVDEVMAGMACRQGAVFVHPDSNQGTEVVKFGRLQAPSATAAPVVQFRKCCALHQVYDLATRLCRDADPGEGGDDEEDADGTPPPPADYESQRHAASVLLGKVFDKNMTALVDMSVGFPDCEISLRLPDDPAGLDDGDRHTDFPHVVLLDIAVFDLMDEPLVDRAGAVRIRPSGPGSEIGWSEGDLVLQPGDYCVDEARGEAGAVVVKVCLDQLAAARHQVCLRFGCFQKCCPHDKYFASAELSHNCVPRPPPREVQPLRPKIHDPPATNLSDPSGYVARSAEQLVDDAYQRFIRSQQPQQVTFSTVVNNVCPQGRFRLETGDEWFFDRLGTLYQPVLGEGSVQYCMDAMQDLAGDLGVLFCLPNEDPTQVEENSRIHLITVGLLISCMFLALTLATYCCLPMLQNLHGKTLMCHVSSMLVAYLLLALTQLLSTKDMFMDNEWVCSVIGNCVLFTFLSAFSWLNVMCFDIWRTFGGMTSTRTAKRSNTARRFRWYCAYAWGTSSLIAAICVIVDQWPGNDKSVFRPQIGDGSCWFRAKGEGPGGEAYGILIFFAGPLLVQTNCNLVLFVLTVRNYSRIKSEINKFTPCSRRVKKFQADSNKLGMNVKLFVVMGVTWVLEVVSTFFDRDHPVFYLSDAANALQGVMIFMIFVMKRKVLRSLAMRFGCLQPPPPCSTNPSIQADCRLATGLAVRGKTISTNTLYTSDFRSSAVVSNRADAETLQ